MQHFLSSSRQARASPTHRRPRKKVRYQRSTPSSVRAFRRTPPFNQFQPMPVGLAALPSLAAPVPSLARIPISPRAAPSATPWLFRWAPAPRTAHRSSTSTPFFPERATPTWRTTALLRSLRLDWLLKPIWRLLTLSLLPQSPPAPTSPCLLLSPTTVPRRPPTC